MSEVIFENRSFIVIDEFPAYAISEFGDVLSLERFTRGKIGQRRVPQKIIRPGLSGKYLNYLQVVLSIDGVISRKKIHALVAQVFIGPRPDSHDVDHIDRNTLNNHVSNLRYLSSGQNRGMRRSRFGGAN